MKDENQDEREGWRLVSGALIIYYLLTDYYGPPPPPISIVLVAKFGKPFDWSTTTYKMCCNRTVNGGIGRPRDNLQGDGLSVIYSIDIVLRHALQAPSSRLP